MGTLLGWLILGPALGAPLEVTVIPADPPPATTPAPRDPAPLVGFARGEVVVDGVLDEPVWAAAPPLALDPVAGGGPPPATRLRVAVEPDGLALALTGLAPGQVAALLVDPDGLLHRWWRVEVDDGGVTWRRCTVAGLPAAEVAWSTFPQAVPCDPVTLAGLEASEGPDGWELRLPWAVVGAPSRGLGLTWEEAGPAGAGTWAPGGRGPLHPVRVRRLDLPPAPLHVRVAPTCGADWAVTARVFDPAAGGPWRWERWSTNGLVDAGAVTLPARGEAAWTLPGTALNLVRWVVRPVDGDPLTAAVVGAPATLTDCAARVTTPVFRDHLDVAYALSHPAPGGRLVVRGENGGVLGEVTVDLPAGAGMIRVGLGGREEIVRVWMGAWVEGAVVVRERR